MHFTACIQAFRYLLSMFYHLECESNLVLFIVVILMSQFHSILLFGMFTRILSHLKLLIYNAMQSRKKNHLQMMLQLENKQIHKICRARFTHNSCINRLRSSRLLFYN